MKSTSFSAITLATVIALAAAAPLHAVIVTDTEPVPAGFPPRPKPQRPTTATVVLRSLPAPSAQEIAVRPSTQPTPWSHES